jgi:hypothetical protein
MPGIGIVWRPALAVSILVGSAALLQSGGISGPRCSGQGVVTSNFNGTRIDGGNYIWFNANLSASRIPHTGATLSFGSSTIQFTADQTYVLNTPNAQITFDPSANCATTSFDPGSNTFFTTVPVSGSDEIFLTGLAFPVPDSFATVGGRVSGPVDWQGTFATNTTGVSVNWKWGAAVYNAFTTNYNALDILPAHGNSCTSGGGDHAGTPEAYRAFVIGGARGGGGSNFTGSWSSTQALNIANCN